MTRLVWALTLSPSDIEFYPFFLSDDPSGDTSDDSSDDPSDDTSDDTSDDMSDGTSDNKSDNTSEDTSDDTSDTSFKGSGSENDTASSEYSFAVVTRLRSRHKAVHEFMNVFKLDHSIP